ncbi:MAG TPA: hypothetical protein VJ653_04145 [Acidimicrobiales bacterium]|nr:hypothetical protein [Acidimicrobiales bacterium]
MEPGRPFLPRVDEAYRVEATILPFPDTAGQRDVVVLDVPATTTGTIGVALRAGGGRLPVQGSLWTPAYVTPDP